jgi:AcrR family transcriptional regulator
MAGRGTERDAEPEPVSTAARGRGRPRDPEADAAILRAALDLFIEHGVDGTSIEQVAKRAGVARLTVYRRWPAKEDLLVQAIETGRAGFADDDLVASLARLDLTGLSGPAALAELADVWVGAMTEPRNSALLARLVGCAATHPSLLAAYWHGYMTPRRERAVPVVRALIAAGMLPAETDPQVLMDIVFGSVVYRVLVNPEPVTPADLRARLLAVLRQCGARLPGLTDEG